MAKLSKILATPYLLLLSCILRPRCCPPRQARRCQRCGERIDVAAFPRFVSERTRRQARVCADCALALIAEAIREDDE